MEVQWINKCIKNKFQDAIVHWVLLGGVTFPHGSPHSAGLCFGSCKGVGDTPGFWAVLSCAGTASRLLLHSLPLKATRLGLGERLEGTQLGQADPEGYFVPYDVVLGNKS